MKPMISDFTHFEKITPLRFDGASYKYAVQGNDSLYILKFEEYPRRKASISHTHHHTSEYIGSHIYESIGLPTQETFLVKRDDRIAVACKHFCQGNTRLYSFKELATDFMHPSISKNSASQAITTLEGTLELISKQTVFQPKVLTDRYWDMFVVDAFIANSDRHNGNWGYLVDNHTFEVSLAPIYDCGSSLFPLLTNEEMRTCLQSESMMKQLSANEPSSTVRYKGAKINFLDFCRNYENPDFLAAVKRMVPRIDMDTIKAIITHTPVITEIRKEFLIHLLTLRKELLLEPALKRAMKAEKTSFNESDQVTQGLER